MDKPLKQPHSLLIKLENMTLEDKLKAAERRRNDAEAEIRYIKTLIANRAKATPHDMPPMSEDNRPQG